MKVRHIRTNRHSRELDTCRECYTARDSSTIGSYDEDIRARSHRRHNRNTRNPPRHKCRRQPIPHSPRSHSDALAGGRNGKRERNRDQRGPPPRVLSAAGPDFRQLDEKRGQRFDEERGMTD